MNEPNTKQVQVSPVSRLKEIMAMPSVQQQFQNAMAEHSSLFVASLIDLFVSDRNLQKCNPQLVVSEALKAATLRLPISKSLGFAYIVPYKDIPTFIIGYKGMIQLAMRTGQYRYINADVVCKGEFKGFDKLTGQLDLTGEKTSDDVVGYFAHIETVNGFQKSMYMSKPDMEKYGKKYSKAFDKEFSPWKKEFDGMAIKTMLRKLVGKFGIMSIEMADGISKDGDNVTDIEYYENANTQLIDIPQPGGGINTDTGEICQREEQPGHPSSAEFDAILAAQERSAEPY